MTALISPYPGGKGGPRYLPTRAGQRVSLICDRPYHYDCIVEPFAGSGAATWQHPHGIRAAIAADVDPGVQAVWECWDDKAKRKKVNAYIGNFSRMVERSPDSGFKFLKNCYNTPDGRSKEHLAAVYLTLKRLVFGGVLRCNKQGDLNVALSQDKFEKYLAGWQYEWPDNGIQEMAFKHSWRGAVEALANSDYENALVVIDPPYFSDKQWIEERHDGRRLTSQMTAAYPGHDPQSADELALCHECLDAVLATGKAARIVVFNYHSDELADRLQRLTDAHHMLPHVLKASNLGPLGNMNNAQKFHGRDDEWAWEIGGKRMFQDVDAVQQLAFA